MTMQVIETQANSHVYVWLVRVHNLVAWDSQFNDKLQVKAALGKVLSMP